MADDHDNFDCNSCTEQSTRGCVDLSSVRCDENLGIEFWYSEERLDLSEGGNATWMDSTGRYMTYCCPLRCISPMTHELVGLYNMCKDLGCLPYEGGLMDQPATLVQGFKVIANEINTKLAETRDKSEHVAHTAHKVRKR